MAARSIQDQLKALLDKRVAEPKSQGIDNPDVEALALLESIASNLLVRPKSILLLALMSKNGLRKLVTDELEAISNLQSSVEDLGNPSLVIRNPSELKKARNSLLQLEQLESLSSTSNGFKRFSSAIDTILSGSVAKALKKKKGTSLTRTGDEAKIDLMSDLAALKSAHSRLIENLYALAVGVENFLASPALKSVGLIAASRARNDIQNILNQIEENSSIPVSRDLAIRLIANRASVSVLGSTPDLNQLLVDSTLSLPAGYSLKAKSASSKPSVSFVHSSEFVALPASATLSITTQGVTNSGNIPQTGFHLDNKACLVGTVISPLTVSTSISLEADPELYIESTESSSETTYRIPLTQTKAAGATSSLTSFIATLNLDLDAAGLLSKFTFYEYVTAGTNRLLLVAVDATVEVFSTVPIAIETVTGSTAPATFTYTRSVSESLGFRDYVPSTTSGTTSIDHIVDCIELSDISLLCDVTKIPLGMSFESTSGEPGTSLSFGGTAAVTFGLNGSTYKASSNRISLYGEVNGESVDPVSPVGLVGVGDLVTLSTGVSSIVAITNSEIVLSSNYPTSDGDITVESILVSKYDDLHTSVMTFLEDSWLPSKYGTDLKSLDSLLAGLAESPTSARKNQFLSALNSGLKPLIENLGSILDAVSLPDGSSPIERETIQGIIHSLEERKFDQALSMFLKCQVQEMLDLGADELSFAGAFLKASSELARSDIDFPNRSDDEKLNVGAVQDKSI